MTLKLCNISVNVANKSIVKDADILVEDNHFVGLVGLNGTGKSTLLKAVYGINEYKGEIFLNDVNINDISQKELYQKIAVLIQENTNDFDFKVKDLVMLGRLPYKKLIDIDTKEDYEIVDDALRNVGMFDFKERYFNTLSGGEKQRVLIARILAQKTNFLILDEPTNHLDIRNQYRFFETIRKLNFTILAVLHDLNIAAKFCDEIYVLNKGALVAHGSPKDVLTTKLLREVFGMEAVLHMAQGNKLHIEYLGTYE